MLFYMKREFGHTVLLFERNVVSRNIRDIMPQQPLAKEPGKISTRNIGKNGLNIGPANLFVFIFRVYPPETVNK